MFADDMKVYVELRDVQCTLMLQQVLHLITVCTTDWQLQISVSKNNILNIEPTKYVVDY